MRINYVLVDYENVKDVDLRDLNRQDVRIVVFLGSAQIKLPSDLVIQMQTLGERAEYIQISGNGPNALDLHIALTIGERAALEPGCYFHIISKDTGFDPLISYLKRRKILSGRYKSVGDLPFVLSSQPKTTEARAVYFIEKLRSPKATKPRTVKTLSNAIQTVFHRSLSVKELEAVIAVLRSKGFVTVKGEAVTYSESVGSIAS